MFSAAVGRFGGSAELVFVAVDSIRSAGTKIIMSTHDLGQARRLADEVVFLHQGAVAETGEAAAFFERPLTPTAAAFLEGRLLW